MSNHTISSSSEGNIKSWFTSVFLFVIFLSHCFSLYLLTICSVACILPLSCFLMVFSTATLNQLLNSFASHVPIFQVFYLLICTPNRYWSVGVYIAPAAWIFSVSVYWKTGWNKTQQGLFTLSLLPHRKSCFLKECLLHSWQQGCVTCCEDLVHSHPSVYLLYFHWLRTLQTLSPASCAAIHVSMRAMQVGVPSCTSTSGRKSSLLGFRLC